MDAVYKDEAMTLLLKSVIGLFKEYTLDDVQCSGASAHGHRKALSLSRGGFAATRRAWPAACKNREGGGKPTGRNFPVAEIK
jgi:hypothetical protein